MGKLLPYVPGFVEQLGQALQGSSEAFGSYLGGKIKHSRATDIMQQIEKQNPSAFGIQPDQQQDFMQQGQQPIEASPMNKTLTSLPEAQFQKYVKAVEALQGKEAAKDLRTQRNIQVKQDVKDRSEAKKAHEEHKNTQMGLQKTVDRMGELINSEAEGIGFTPFKFSDKARENIGEWDALRAGLEKDLAPLVSQGRLTDKRFEYILSLIPNSHDTLPKARGKIKGLSSVLSEQGYPINLDKLTGKKSRSEPEKERLQKVEPGTKLTPDLAKSIKEQSGGDNEKARKLARELGYEF